MRYHQYRDEGHELAGRRGWRFANVAVDQSTEGPSWTLDREVGGAWGVGLRLGLLEL